MSNNPRPDSLSSTFPEARDEPFAGALGHTRLENVHLSLASGEIASVRVHTVVNASTDPALAERLLRGELNWIQAAGAADLEQVSIPVVYHDETLRVFALVLPEPYRARELQERADLLRALDQDRSSPIPRYVVEFTVVYGAEGLANLLARVGREPQAAGADDATDDELAFREAEIVAREANLLDWEDRLDLREQRLSSLERGAVEDVGAAVQEGEARLQALDLRISRRQEELEAIEGLLRQHPQADADVDSPTRVADRAKMERAARAAEVIESGEESLDFESSSALSAAEADVPALEATDQTNLSLSAPSARGNEPEESAAGQHETAGFAERGEGGDAKRGSDQPTPLARALLAATEASEPNLALDESSEATLSEPEEEPSLEDIPSAREDLPEPLLIWKEQESPEPIWYVDSARIHLCVALAPQDVESFVGTDPVAILQMHSLPTYPLVTLGILADAQALDDHGAFTVFWPFDVAAESDRDVLALLAEDFRLVLEVYDESLEAVIEQELHFPLEENARIVKERALALWEEMSEQDRDPDVAMAAFGRADYPKLATEPLPLATTDFQTLETAADVAAAAQVVADWSTPERENELLLQRSFPAAAWRAMRLRVLRAAIDLGVWLETPLRRIALEAGFATSRRDFIRASLAGFEHATLEEKLGEMSAAAVKKNWEALLAEAERLGVVVEPRWEALSAEAAEVEPRFPAAEAELDGAGVEERGTGGAERQGEGTSDGDLETAPSVERSRLTEPLERLDESDLLEAEDLVEEERSSVLEPGDLAELDTREPDVSGDPLEDGFEEVDAEDLILEEDPDASDAEVSGEVAGEPTFGETPLFSEDLETLSSPELVVLLGDERQKLSALVELVRRGDKRALPEMFSVLDSLDPSGCVEALQALATFASEAEPYFITALRSGVTAVRIGSASVLGAMACERAEEGLLDLLLDEPTDGWTVVAEALATLGSGTVMSLASRIVHSSDSQRERIAYALAWCAWRTDDRGALVGLSQSQDEQAAMVATRALSRLAELVLEAESSASTAPEEEGGTMVEQLGSRLAKVLLPEREGDEDGAEALPSRDDDGEAS